MRVLTVDAKRHVTDALDQAPGVELWRLKAGGCRPGPREMPYNHGPKLQRASIRQVRDAIRQIEPDIVHAFYPRPMAHAVLAMMSLGPDALGGDASGRPKLVGYRGIMSKVSPLAPAEWITHLSPRFDAHACESEAVKRSLVDAGVPAERCHVVYNCLTNQPAARRGRAALAEWGVAEGHFVVMMVANLRRVKAPELLLEAALACRDLPRLRVVMVGREVDADVLRLAHDRRLKGRVVLTGPQPQAVNLIGAADLFVQPSRAEALSVALLEAMSEGVCPVVSDAGGLPEAVRDGVDGVVFPRGDAAALTAAIRRLYADDEARRAYAATAQRRAREFFSPEAMADRLVKLYSSLCPPAVKPVRAAA